MKIKNKKANLLCNKSQIQYACFFSTGDPLGAGCQQRTATVYIKLSFTHHASLGDGQALVEAGLPDTKPTAAPARIESSLTRACTQWRSRILSNKWEMKAWRAGWLTELRWRSASKSSASGLYACSLLDFSFGFFVVVEHFWGRKSVSATLAVCRLKGESQQVAQGSKFKFNIHTRTSLRFWCERFRGFP